MFIRMKITQLTIKCYRSPEQELVFVGPQIKFGLGESLRCWSQLSNTVNHAHDGNFIINVFGGLGPAGWMDMLHEDGRQKCTSSFFFFFFFHNKFPTPPCGSCLFFRNKPKFLEFQVIG